MSVDRGNRLAELVAAEGLDSLIVGDLVRPGDSGPDAIADIRWLTGFSGTSGLALVGEDRREFLTDFRYTERARAEVFEGWDRVTLEGRFLRELARRLEGRVGFDDEATSVASLAKIQGDLPQGVELVATRGLISQLRRRKDAAEVERIAAASDLADEVFERLASLPLAGRTERQVALQAEAWLRELGGEPAFPTIVAGGPTGSQPHAEPGDRAIGPAELVVIDMGARLDGYCSDGTRTFASGEVGEEERDIYELVARSQLASLDAIRAGLAGREADAVSRDPIEEAGHGEHYGHGLGHGVGLEVHEAPRLGKTSEDVLQAGDVVTVEPGVYLPGKFGVRIEDLVLVEDDGNRNLSSTDKSLRIAGA